MSERSLQQDRETVDGDDPHLLAAKTGHLAAPDGAFRRRTRSYFGLSVPGTRTVGSGATSISIGSDTRRPRRRSSVPAC